MRTIVEEIERELLAPRAARPKTPECLACGRPFTIGDSRFCSPRCRVGFDVGLPFYDPGYVRRVSELPLTGWRVIVDPSGVGSNPWQGVIDASARRRAEQQGELIRPRRFCVDCGAKLPVWVKGRAVNSTRTHCFSCSPPGPQYGGKARSTGRHAPC